MLHSPEEPNGGANPTEDAQQQPGQPEGTKSFAAFLNMLEDGKTHSDLSEHLRELNAAMNNAVLDRGGKAKGKLTLEVEFMLDKGVFEIQPSIKVKLPETKRNRTIAWSTPGNNFTPHNPRQMNLFERPREVSAYGRGEVREAL